jgi:endoglucanase
VWGLLPRLLNSIAHPQIRYGLIPMVKFVALLLLLPGLINLLARPCTASLAPLISLNQPSSGQSSSNQSSNQPSSGQPSNPPATAEILQQSWSAYRERFIQADGRVIDRENNARTVSEGQAYAMLRSVFANDPDTFGLTFKWAEANLARRGSDGNRLDSLWAWKWGQDQQNWGILDNNFASDADLDAVTALILASRRWNRPDYLELARTKLNDLWALSTVTAPGRKSQRYFLPGPLSSFQPQPNQVYLNPSYLAPYAFRLFAQVDPNHDWLSLVNSSYQVLQNSTQLSEVGLPSDWVMLNLETGQFQAPPVTAQLRSTYSFDAYRVWWRVALDAVWFNSREAKTFLADHLPHLQELWRTQQAIPARINLRGFPTARYEATSQYAMLYPALQLIDAETAAQIRQQKLLANYSNGIWDNDSAYYTQNLAWLGLFPAAEMQAWVRGD